MSKAYDLAMKSLDVGSQSPAPGHSGTHLPIVLDGRCWRCRSNLARVPGTDFTCEPCWAYLTEQTDEDTR